MKLSTLAAQAAPAKRPRLGEIGAVGTTFYSGFTAGVEHNADLTGSRGLDVWERMFRSDGTARAVELAYVLPLAGANMAVEPPTTKGRAKEMAEAAERMLRTMAISWEQTLRAQLFYLRYGYYLFEKVWAYRDGRYVLAELSPRPPRTLYRWYLTETGKMDGAQFRVWKPTAHGFGTIPVGSHQYIDIPRDKLLHLVNGQEAGNFTGESLGRAMYKAWKMKETLELITMIGVEKREIGTETAFMGPKANEDDARDMATALASLHANAKGYLIVPDKEIVERLEIFGTGGTRGNATTLVEYHKREMALSGLAGFLTLGDGGGGSYAQSRDKTSLFLIALKAVADYLADVNTREIIHPFCRYNWPGVADDELPRMTFSGLDTRNMQQFAAMIVQLVAGGILAPDAVVRAAVRADLDLPEEAKNITAIMDQKAGLVEPPEPTEPEPEPVEEDEEEELEPLPEDEPDDVPPDNLLLTLDDVPVGYAEYAQVDPSRYEVTPDGTSKLGYKVIDKQTGRRLTGYAAIKVKEALDKLAARGAKGKGGAGKGKAEGAKAGGKGPDPAKEAERAAAKAEQARRREEADRRRADADERRKKLDERRDKMDTERAKRQEAADKRREEADRRREDAAAKRESDRAKREQDAGRREADKQQRATDKATIDAAKSERDGLASDVAKLDSKAAAEKLKSAGWEPAGGGADAASAAVEARKVAAANPDKIVTVVKTKTGSMVVTKPKKSFAGGKGENQLSMNPELAERLQGAMNRAAQARVGLRELAEGLRAATEGHHDEAEATEAVTAILNQLAGDAAVWRNPRYGIDRPALLSAGDDEGESFEVDPGIGDDLDIRLAGAAERIAGYLFVDRGEDEDEE